MPRSSADGHVVGSRTFARKQAKRTIDLPHLGPATCEARLVSNVAVSLSYVLRLSLAVEGT